MITAKDGMELTRERHLLEDALSLTWDFRDQDKGR
jgi:hypothetical protein